MKGAVSQMGLKSGVVCGKEGFTDMKYEGNGFRKKEVLKQDLPLARRVSLT